MNLFLACAVIVGFAALLERLPVQALVGDVKAEAEHAMAVLRNGSLDDESRGRNLRQSSLRLTRLALATAGLGAVALLAPLGVVRLLEIAGLGSLDGVLEILERSDFLFAATLVGIATFFLVHRRT